MEDVYVKKTILPQAFELHVIKGSERLDANTKLKFSKVWRVVMKNKVGKLPIAQDWDASYSSRLRYFL